MLQYRDICRVIRDLKIMWEEGKVGEQMASWPPTSGASGPQQSRHELGGWVEDHQQRLSLAYSIARQKMGEAA